MKQLENNRMINRVFFNLNIYILTYDFILCKNRLSKSNNCRPERLNERPYIIASVLRAATLVEIIRQHWSQGRSHSPQKRRLHTPT